MRNVIWARGNSLAAMHLQEVPW